MASRQLRAAWKWGAAARGCHRLRARCWLLAACCLPALLTACVPPGSVPRTVKIGVSAPFEGLYRDLGYEALYAVRLAVLQYNQAGGAGGQWLVELVALNDFNEVAEAVRQAGEMAADPDVLGVVGGLSPRTASPSILEYERSGIPFITPAAHPERFGQEAARFAVHHLQARSAAILEGGDAADRAQARGFAEQLVGEGGQVLAQTTPEAARTIAGFLSGLSPSPDVLFLAAEMPAAAEWIAAAREAGFRGAIVGGPEVGSSLTVEIAGPASDGVYFASPFGQPAEDAAFRSAYEALSGGAAPGPVAAWCHAAAQEVLAAIDAGLRGGREPSRAAVLAALAGQRLAEPAITIYGIRDGEVFVPVVF
jgi:ABC-type branched-subunit amino acid transport system substrate-binding protein